MLTYFLIVACVMALCLGLHWLWRRGVVSDLKEGAQVEFEDLNRQGSTLLDGLDYPAFEKLYVKTHLPRFPAYAITILAVFLIGTPIIITLQYGLVYVLTIAEILPEPSRVATQLYLSSDGASPVRQFSPETLAYIVRDWSGFYYFFGLLGFWMLTAYILLRRYHKRTPGTLKEEILRAR